MIGSFSFNGVESSEFNLVCRSVTRPLLPAVKVKRVEMNDVSGAYDFDNDEYELRKITMRIAYLGTSYTELRSRAREIAAWLSTNTWVPLIINDEPDKYYLAKVTDELLLDSLWESGGSDVKFDCQPFAYSINEVNVVESYTSPVPNDFGDTPILFENSGTRKINFKSPIGSKSLITFSGSWDLIGIGSADRKHSIIVNKQVSNGVLVIDNVNMTAYLDGDINCFNDLDGNIDEFITISPGDNSLLLGGVNVDVTVTINYIPMWK